MGIAAGGPLPQEGGLPLGCGAVHRDGVDVHAVLHQAVAPCQGRAGKGPQPDAREQAGPIAAEVGHAGGAVVQHPGRLRPRGYGQCAEHRQAGMAAGKGIDLRGFEPAPHGGAVRGVLQVFLREAPAGGAVVAGRLPYRPPTT